VVRRRFVNWLFGTAGGALFATVFYPVLRFVTPPDVPEATTNQVDAGPTNDPDLIDRGFKIVRFGAEPVLLVRVADDDYRAFSAVCTHLDCIVEYQKGNRRIFCNCHNGEYDLHGRHVSGPPPRALEEFNVDLVSGGRGQPATIMVSRA